MPRVSNIVVIVAALAAIETRAHADDDLRDRTIGHVITAPTAWLPPGGDVVVSAGIDHHGGTLLSGGIGFGDLASIELGTDSDVLACHNCGPDQRDEPVRLGRAQFKLGARQDALFRGQPALAFGVRTTFFGKHATLVSDAFVVASYDLGPIRLHAGAGATDAADDLSEKPRGKPLREELRGIRPLGGFEWTPNQYPKTSLNADIVWVPRLRDTIENRFATAAAVRYQAFTWGSIELGMRYREKEEIGDSTFFVRMNMTTR